MVTIFGANQRKLAHPPSFTALAFRYGLEDRNADGRVNSGDDPSTSDRNLLSGRATS